MRQLACLLPLLAGCTAVNATDMHTPVPVEADEFCVHFSEVICDAAVNCCSRTDEDRDTCVTRIGVVCASGYSTLLADPRTGYDAEEAGVQLAIGRRLALECDPDFRGWALRGDQLLSSLLGTVEPLESCDPEGREVWTPGPGMAVRVELPRFYSCTEGLACRTSAGVEGPWTCRTVGAAGEFCIGLADCEPDLGCVPMDTGARCGARLSDGADCAIATQCDSYICQGGTCRANDTLDQTFCNIFRS